PLYEPWFFAPYRWLDRRRYERGQSWDHRLPFWLQAMLFLWKIFHAIFGRVSSVKRRLLGPSR
ncbi:MAG: hypothetical protein AAFV29_15815, partial [Myxococcota bacterium]